MTLFFTVVACEEESLKIDENNDAIQQAENPSEVIYGKIIKVGPRYEDVIKNASKENDVIGTSQPWRQLSAHAINHQLNWRSEGFFTAAEKVYKDDFLIGRTPGHSIPKITNISLNQQPGAFILNPFVFGTPLESVNAMDVLNEPNLPFWRYKAEGTYEDSSPVGGWTPVPGYTSLVKRNTSKVGKTIPGELWRTEATTKSTTTTVTLTGEITFAGEIGLPLVANGSTSVSLSASGGTEKSTSFTAEENFSTPDVFVPPGMGVRYTLVERWKPVETYWNIPIEFKGPIGFRVQEKNNQIGNNTSIWRNATRLTNRPTNSLNHYYKNKCMRVKVIERLSHDFYVMPTIIQ